MVTDANQKDADRPLILVVEDEPSVLKLIRMILSDAGYPMLTAENGSAALEISRTHPGAIRLLITDIQLPPNMNGLSLAHAVRGLHPDLHVLYISGYNSIFDRIREEVDCRRAWFLQKPFSPKELVEAVKKAL